MASAAPSALTPIEKPNGQYYWYCFWRDSDGNPKSKSFGNTKKVLRRDAEHRYREWLKAWTPDPVRDDWRKRALSVAQLCDKYVAWITKKHTRKVAPNPHQTEYGRPYHVKIIVHHLRKKFGHYAVKDFRPSMLLEIRDEWIENRWLRKTINQYTSAIIRMLRYNRKLWI